MKLAELIAGADGKLAHLKVWNNIAAAVFTAVVVHREWWLFTKEGVPILSDELLIWYAGMLIAGVVVNKAATAVTGK